MRDLFLQHFLLHRSEALCLLLGSQPEFPACPVAMDQELYDEQCGKAAWLLDKVSKNYIVRCWRVRQSMIGTITIGEGKLVQSPPCSLPTWTGKVSLGSAGVDPLYRSDWLQWRPRKPVSVSLTRPRKQASNFYTVRRGRTVGVFYR